MVITATFLLFVAGLLVSNLVTQGAHPVAPLMPHAA